MSKLNLNDPCPCGSRRKYKRCCHTKSLTEKTSSHKPFALNTTQPASSHPWGLMPDEDNLTRESNHVVKLIHEGRLDEAEIAAKKLLQDYPEVHDGLERLAMVYEARGDRGRALEMYEKSLAFTLNNENYAEEMRDYYRRKIHQLQNLTSA